MSWNQLGHSQPANLKENQGRTGNGMLFSHFIFPPLGLLHFSLYLGHERLACAFITNHFPHLDFFFLIFEFYLFFLHSRSLLVINFIHISVYISIPVTQFITPPPPPRRFPPLVSIPLFSTSVSQILPCKLVHLYHFSRLHIYALIYDICFSLSDLLHFV